MTNTNPNPNPKHRWTVAGFDLSKMAVTYCPYTCRKCQGMGAKALADGAPPLLSELNYNISREIRRRVLYSFALSPLCMCDCC